LRSKASPRSTNASVRTSDDRRRIDCCDGFRCAGRGAQTRGACGATPARLAAGAGMGAGRAHARRGVLRTAARCRRAHRHAGQERAACRGCRLHLARLRARLRHRLCRRRAAAVPAAPLAAGERGGRALHHGLDAFPNTRWRRGSFSGSASATCPSWWW